MTKWVAYTDGACAPSNPGPAAWGAVVFGPYGGEVAAHSGFIGHGTNQIAEITAANRECLLCSNRISRATSRA